jgi:hypothetical protein
MIVSPLPNPQAEDHPLSAVRDCLLNVFAATLHIDYGGRLLYRQPEDEPCRDASGPN